MSQTSQRHLIVAGLETNIKGNINDEYFRSIEVLARQLDPLVDLVDRHVSQDGCILDVGANIGISAIALARTRPKAQIFAFEPSPINSQFLSENLATNGIENVKVVPCAVSDTIGYLSFHESQFGAGSHVVSRDHLTPQSMTTQVPMVTLDSFAQDLGDTISFIKIDAEGHEPNILAGGRICIGTDCPLLYVEFNSWCLNAFGGHSPAAFARSLWHNFEILEEDADRCLAATVGLDPLGFLHRNLVRHGCVDDLILRLREGASCHP